MCGRGLAEEGCGGHRARVRRRSDEGPPLRQGRTVQPEPLPLLLADHAQLPGRRRRPGPTPQRLYEATTNARPAVQKRMFSDCCHRPESGRLGGRVDTPRTIRPLPDGSASPRRTATQLNPDRGRVDAMTSTSGAVPTTLTEQRRSTSLRPSKGQQPRGEEVDRGRVVSDQAAAEPRSGRLEIRA